MSNPSEVAAWLRSDAVVMALVEHQPTSTSGCICGWADLGRVHPRHVAAKLAELISNDEVVTRPVLHTGREIEGLPVQAAAVLHAYADRHHYVAGGHPGSTGPGEPIDPTAWCACGAEVGEDGCSEREQLLADAAAIERGEQPASTPPAAPEAPGANLLGLLP